MIGIGITTRNRARVLGVSLLHLFAYTSNISEYKVHIYNDTDPENSTELEAYNLLLSQYPQVSYQYGQGRVGIAKAKNECIKALKGCSHYFLFDDDAFPKKEGWEKLYIDTAQATNCQHLMHLAKVLEHTFSDEYVSEYRNCMGILLYFTQFAINTLGGYDPRFGLYGFEHSQISNRACKAGLTGKYGPYITPKATEEFIYSFDIAWNHYVTPPPLGDFSEFHFNSSLIGDESKVDQFISYNTQFASDITIKFNI